MAEMLLYLAGFIVCADLMRKSLQCALRRPHVPLLPAALLCVPPAVMGMGHWEKEFVEWDDDLLDRFGISPETFGEGPKVELEQGEKLFMMVGEYVDAPENPARADHHLMENGYISITSHQFDNTDAREFRRMLENGIDQDF